jgi:hypothetical protein
VLGPVFSLCSSVACVSEDAAGPGSEDIDVADPAAEDVPSAGRYCTGLAVPAVWMTVGDVETGESICDATVGVVDDEGFVGWSSVNQCLYSVGWEMRGVLTITVTKDGYEPRDIDDLLVGSSPNGCHPDSLWLHVELVPVAGSGAPPGRDR